MSDTILAISRASAHSKFLKDFYSFTTIFNTWELSIVWDPEQPGYDSAILTTLDEQSWVLIWVVDTDTLKLSPRSEFNTYHSSVLWYRWLSATEIIAINADPTVVYDYDFFWDKLFSNFYLRDFQLQVYNSGSTLGTTMWMDLSIFPDYKKNLKWEQWNMVPQDSIFYYSLTF